MNAVLLFVLLFSTLKTWLWHSSFVWIWVLAFFLFATFLYFDYRKNNQQAQYWVVFGLIALTIIVVLSGVIGDRFLSKDSVGAIVHDGLIQTEEAVRFLREGKNPYSKNYIGTLVERVGNGVIQTIEEDIKNPALYYYVYLPWTFLVQAPLTIVSEMVYGWYDQRLLFLLLFLLSLFIISRIPVDHERRLTVLTLFGLNPLFLQFFFEGRNDIHVFFLLLLSIVLLQKNKVRLSAAVLGIAMATKQFAWLFLPFYCAYLFSRESGTPQEKLNNVAKKIWPCALTFAVIILPFLLWDAKSFIEDIYLYPSGVLQTSYPIAGYGLSVLLYQLGIVPSIFSYFPFGILQLFLGIPLLAVSIYRQSKNPAIATMTFHYGFFFLVFFFSSRFLQDNYVGFASMVFIAAYAFDTRRADTFQRA